MESLPSKQPTRDLQDSLSILQPDGPSDISSTPIVLDPNFYQQMIK